jgi:UrcA family protein
MEATSSFSRLSLSAAVCAALAVATFPTGSTALEPSEEPTAVRVPFKGLDLRRPADAVVFLSRLHDAAIEACGGSSFSASEYIRAIEKSECFKTSVAHAIDAVHAPEVSRLFRATAPSGE